MCSQQVPGEEDTHSQGLCPALHHLQQPGGVPGGPQCDAGGRRTLFNPLCAALHQCATPADLVSGHHGARVNRFLLSIETVPIALTVMVASPCTHSFLARGNAVPLKVPSVVVSWLSYHPCRARMADSAAAALFLAVIVLSQWCIGRFCTKT